MGLRLSRRALIGGIGPVLGTVALSGVVTAQQPPQHPRGLCLHPGYE